ncbi:hypothetical protein [Brevibacterium senegalense]|uniref:hypothetical protein n=1 Tax=Brevibacterium senegalense TaxID=1033736 RepID=UPI00036146DA|nr:hypothetical protein [Brevibacterium senegalense]
MTRRAWVRLDNASNIFLAAWTDADPKVFRITAEVDDDIDPALLQQALDATFDRYPLYHAVLRRGIFWYYLQDSDLRPTVTPDLRHTCAPLHHPDRKELLFRVVHHHRRISLEVFHALSDGTGALWFLTDLLTAYLALRHPEGRTAAPGQTEDTAAEAPAGTRSPADPPGQAGDQDSSGAPGSPVSPGPSVAPDPALDADPAVDPDPLEGAHPLGLTPDSFVHYFHRTPPPERLGRRVGDISAHGADEPVSRRPGLVALRRVHRVTGTRTPDDRPRLIELSMPAPQVLALAKPHGVPVTLFLTALFFEAVRESSGGLGKSQTIAASVPVNLRQFFPSLSPRNFFATVRVAHTYGRGDDDLGGICRDLAAQFLPETTPEALEAKLRRFLRFERSPLLRIVPRPLKDLLLRLINRANNRGLTVAVSNLGRVVLPEPAEARVRRMLFHVSAVRPQFCSMTHDGVMTISFTSPFQEADHVRAFTRMLTEQGVDVTVAAARVTEQEIEDSPAGVGA